MMISYILNNLNTGDLNSLIRRPRIDFEWVFSIVAPIIDDIRSKGDEALRNYTNRFDGVDIPDPVHLVRPLDEIKLPDYVKKAFLTAYDNIRAFHEHQLNQGYEVETMPGVHCSRIPRPIESVGLYVPGGTAILPSSVLMLGIPAKLAGCKNIILATPPRPDGSVSPEVEYAAAICGIEIILKAGGAQAVAALAWGTKSVPKVDKIFGPGNQYVTGAKMLLQNSDALVAIDMPAGPSEVLVIADKSANPAWVAADLLSQAEHGADSQVILVAINGFDIDSLQSELASQLSKLPRSEAATKSLNHSYIMIADDPQSALDFSNLYAPEHLIINTDDADQLVDGVLHAGSVFVGPWTPESVGDYASGTNHTLPTYGFAKMYSGVSVDSFRKQMTVQKLTKEGLRLIGPTVEIMAATEGLDAHKRAVSIRLEAK